MRRVNVQLINLFMNNIFLIWLPKCLRYLLGKNVDNGIFYCTDHIKKENYLRVLFSQLRCLNDANILLFC